MAAEALPPPLVVSQDHSWPPFAFVNDQGEPRGLLVDLWQEIGTQLGRSVEFRMVDWPDTITAVAEGGADIHGGLFPSPERAQILDFSEALMPLSAAVFVRAELPILTVDELPRQPIGVVAGSYEREYTHEHYPQLALQSYNNNDSMVAAALAGEIDAFIADYPVGMYLLDRRQGATAFRPLEKLYAKQLHAAVALGNDGLRREINNALASLPAEDLRRLSQRWLRSETVEVPIFSNWLLTTIALGAVILALLTPGLLLWRQRGALRAQVRQRTAQLNEQKELFLTLAEHTTAGIFIARGMRLVVVNTALASLLRRSAGSLVGVDLWSLVHPGDRRRLLLTLRNAGSQATVLDNYELRLSLPGHPWLAVSAARGYFQGREAIIGTAFDLSERKQAELALRESEAHNRRLIDNLAVEYFIYIHNRDGYFTFISPSVEHILGWSAHEFQQHYQSSLTDHPMNQNAIARTQASLEGRKQAPYQVEVFHKDGRKIIMEVCEEPITDDHGTVIAIEGIAHDVSQRLRFEEQAREQHEELRRIHASMQRDVEAAGHVQRSLLPTQLPRVAGVEVAWQLRPSAVLAGDTLNVCRLDEHHLACYLLDVSGHGVSAALLSVQISRMLSPQMSESTLLKRPSVAAPGYELVAPSEVLANLNRQFPLQAPSLQFFTMIYGILDVRSGHLRYAVGGHPPLLVQSREGSCRVTDGHGCVVGVDPQVQYRDYHLTLQPGDRLFWYSDGLFEALNADGEAFGSKRLQAIVEANRQVPIDAATRNIMQQIDDWCRPHPPDDDCSLLALEYRGSGPTQA